MVVACSIGLQGGIARRSVSCCYNLHAALRVDDLSNVARVSLRFNPLATISRSGYVSVSMQMHARRLRYCNSSSGKEFRTILCSSSTGSSQEPELQRPDKVDLVVEEEKVKRKRNRKNERTLYLLAAIASSTGFTTLAAAAVYYRFVWQMQGGEVPYSEVMGTFTLAVGAAVGMEFWARWAHKALWHASLWNMHESHHRPREGPFELNDVFAIINAVPAIALMAYGFFHKGLVPGLCFGAGLGITMFGMAYMFVHDGLVHRRFPVGPVADVPYLQKVAAAHQLHHADLFGGVPYGLFLGPQELENVGGEEELLKLLAMRSKARDNDRQQA